MSEATTVWLRPPFGVGEPKQVEATPDVLIPLMNSGWAQCDPPARLEEVIDDVHD